MEINIEKAERKDLDKILQALRLDAVKNAWAIQDLTRFFEKTEFYFSWSDGKLSYLLCSGHPGAQDVPTYIAEGDPVSVLNLLHEVKPTAPFVMRQTSAHLQGVLRGFFPTAKIYLQQRMDLSSASFKPQQQKLARDLTEADAAALAVFLGAPPQAAERFKNWLGQTKGFVGIFNSERLVSMASTMISIPEVWNVIAVKTHPDFLKRGYATEVTSVLCAKALAECPKVTLAVVKDNAAAIKVYEKLGFEWAQDILWLDVGANMAP